MAGRSAIGKRVRGNPFHFGPAVPEEFVGRWPVVNEMASELSAGQVSYACVGGRRIGKTSLLVALRHVLWRQSGAGSDQPALPLLLDPTIARFDSADQFFAHLLREVRRRCDIRLTAPADERTQVRVPLDGILVEEPSSNDPPAITAVQFAEVMNVILNRLEDHGGARRLIVLIDEVDSLLGYSWRKDLFAQLRASLVSGDLHSRLRLVLAGSHRFLEEATDLGSPLWNVLNFQYLTAFDESATYKLTTRADGLSQAVLQAVWQQSGGHPFLAQYLLHYLWKAGSARAAVADVTGLAGKFTQQWATVLDGWSRAIGLAGLQIYGLFVDAADPIERQTIVQRVNDPSVPVTQALTALCYHGLIIPNSTWSLYCRGSDLFRDWYVQEVPRLIARLTPSDPTPLASPNFWIQLTHHGPLQAVFKRSKEVHVGPKYDFSQAKFDRSILNIESDLKGAVQTVSEAGNLEPSTQKRLQELLEQLEAALKQVPPDKAADAEAVAALETGSRGG